VVLNHHQVAVAAGNDGINFEGSSPADAAGAFAVGASDSNDAIAYFSNYGAYLGAFAPGTDVISLWNNGGAVSAATSISSIPPRVHG
jgi:subtilisin family serine protease